MSTIINPATADDLRAYFKGKGYTVLTFLGYSAAGYEDEPAMIEEASRIIDGFPVATTIVNCGATQEGIGAVYDIAKRKGYATSGIVSTQADKDNVALSESVDVVFYVEDDSWGGLMPDGKLSPTSAAMVEYSDVMVAIGGGNIARDEMIGARQAGKSVRFIAADMNHSIAKEKAIKKGVPVPTEFGGEASAAA